VPNKDKASSATNDTNGDEFDVEEKPSRMPRNLYE